MRFDYNKAFIQKIPLLYIIRQVTGGNDKIKLDINYHNRCHILDGQLSEIPFPFSITDIPLPVAHVATTELFAGKIKAFYERCKPRDIYDVSALPHPASFLQKRKDG